MKHTQAQKSPPQRDATGRAGDEIFAFAPSTIPERKRDYSKYECASTWGETELDLLKYTTSRVHAIPDQRARNLIIERLTSVQKITGSTFIGNSEFLLCPMLVTCEI